MKQLLLFSSLLYCFSGFSQTLEKTASQQKSLSEPQKTFDMKKAYEEAKAKGILAGDIPGYVSTKKNEFSSARALEKQPHKHTPYEQASKDVHETIIYLTPNNPNTPQTIGCTNLGFEQYNFSGWAGGTGTVTIGPAGGNPNYNPVGAAIVNTAGNNVSVVNATNYHTVLTIPPTNPSYPTCAGYDSLAVHTVPGLGQVSAIPFVSPYSFDPVSVRLNSANANYRAARLKYVATSSSNTQRLSFSYALLFLDPALSHNLPEEAPYFTVSVRNETTGTLLAGCTSYSFNSIASSAPSDSLFVSDINFAGDLIKYRKWQYYTVDLSTLPLGTNVSINFEVGGCTQSGHWGYAYVDAECGGTAAPYVNMCVGSTYATMVAPTGFINYQWFDPSNTPIPGATNDTLLITNPGNGNVYTVQMTSPGGCVVTSTVSIIPTTVNIINLNSTSSCAGGNSGTAYVQASGSSLQYTYMWTSTSGPNIGTVVGTTQTATGLAPGTYSVVVTSPGCGQASANLSVGVTPAQFFVQTHPFCGNSAAIPKPGGTNYQWYTGTTPIPGPVGTNDTLYISPAVNGASYNLTYTNAFGCRDSVQFNLSMVTGGTSYLSALTNVCPGSNNGSVVLNLSTPFASPYIYTVKSSTSTVLGTTTSNTNVPVSPLAAGSYTATITDGVCIYVNTFTIFPIPTNFTITTTNTVLCFPTDTAKINLTYGTVTPNFCGTDPNVCASGITPNTLFASGPFFNNTNTTYPSPYAGNNYSGKHQFLVKAADLTAAGISAGKISSLAFNITNMNSSASTYADYQIKMGCTSTTDFVSSGSGPSFIAGLQTVYFNASQPVATGWLTHNFSQAYVWDGSSNIVVEVCSGGANTTSGNPSFEMKQMSYIANMRSISSSSGVSSCPATVGNGTGNLMANGDYMLPNMKFTNCAYAPPASSYTVSVSPGSIAHNYGNDSLKILPPFTTPPTNNLPITYTISVTNPIGGCVATHTVAMLYPSLTNTVTATPTQSTICIGTPVNLSSSGTLLYNWFYMQNGTAMPVSTSPTITVTPPVAGTNTYIVTGSSPCPSSVPDSKTVTINVLPKADLLISPLQDITKCMDKPYVITTGVGSATPGNAGTPYAYSWTTLPGNSPAPGTNTASSYTMDANSTTTLVVTVTGQCANASTDTVVISNFVNDLTVSILNSSTTCPNTPFTLTATASGGYPEYTFGWFMDGSTNAVSNTTSAAFVSPGTQGEYSIAVYVNDSCGYSKADYEIIVVTAPCSVEIPNVITPNNDAANDFFKIKNIEFHPNTNVTIFDRWGRKVYENPNYNNEWKADGVSDGTFFYVIDVPDDKKYNGFVTVFRK
jgi:gliding motility-associated-like protein